MNRVRFYFDVVCPYAYLGSTQIERVAREAGASIAWRPLLLGAVFKNIGSPTVPIFEHSEVRRRYIFRDFQHWADHWGVPFRFPSRFPMNTVAALRTVLAAAEPERPRLTHALFGAYWADDRDIGDKAVLAELCGAALVERIEDPQVKAALRANTDEAVARGAFGVPSFFVDDQLIFGQDRLDFLAAALAGKQL
jgi:2-hydroxychromene-2-carboxylate isomerase